MLQRTRRIPFECSPRSLPRILQVAAWFLIGVHALCSAQPANPNEYQLKAAFLFNFLQFVDWPPSAFAGPQDPLSICVLGPDPFGTDLDSIIAGERIGGREIQIQRLTPQDAPAGCHLLFVNLRSTQQLRSTLSSLKGQPILTVSDATPFAHLGGMIEFVTQNDRIRLRVNLHAASEAQLRLSSKLLRRSEIVGTA